MRFPRLGRLRLEQITPRHIAEFVAWLCDEKEQGCHLADATVKRILAPVRSCLRTAMREGLIRHNPTRARRCRRVTSKDASRMVGTRSRPTRTCER